VSETGLCVAVGGLPGVRTGAERLGRDKERLLVRPAAAGDRAALEGMFQRCSPATVYQRFHGQVRAFPRAYLDEALAGTDVHYAVTCYSGCAAVALASYRIGEPGSAELGIVVEDAWQRRGLGGLLLGELVAHARDHGIGVLHAQMLTEQDWITKMLARHGPWTSAFGRGVRDVTLHLAASGTDALSAPEGAPEAGASPAGAVALGGRGTG
jgi:GNAT superfamily N-acetyltransferase